MKKISAEAFESIIQNLRSDGAARHVEKRSAPRVGLRSRVDITLSAKSFSGGTSRHLTAWVRGLSAGGIDIVVPQHMERGAMFIAEFHRERRGTIRVQYRVAHCKALSKGLYSVGARIDAGMN